jgi:hypothetical protein
VKTAPDTQEMPKNSFGDDGAGNGFLHTNLGTLGYFERQVCLSTVLQIEAYRNFESISETDKIPFRVWLTL